MYQAKLFDILLLLHEYQRSHAKTEATTRLQDELITTQKREENSVRLLRAVLDDIQLAIERSANGSENQDLIAFEAEHPKLTASLSKIAEFLAGIGI